MYLEGRVLVGGYTIRAIRDGLSGAERKTFDKNAPFLFEAPIVGSSHGPAELVGKWDVVSIDGGNGPNARPGISLVITENFMGMVSKDGATKPMGEIVAAHTATQPKGIDLGMGGAVGLGIYEVVGNSAKLIVNNPGLPRPREFKGQPTGILFVLNRRV
jgi:uncharacterized protein (TIGR03067 family)